MRVQTGGQATRCPTQHPVSAISVQGWFLFFLAHCLLLATSCILVVATSASAAEVWVVTDRLHAVKTNSNVRFIDVDAPTHFKAELAVQLPPDPKQATAIVQQRLKSGGADLHQRLALAYQGVVDAWSLGIVKLPAIVVDRRYVVYGEPDIDRAVSKIKEYRNSRP